MLVAIGLMTLAVHTPQEIVRAKELLEAEDGKNGFQVIRIRLLCWKLFILPCAL